VTNLFFFITLVGFKAGGPFGTKTSRNVNVILYEGWNFNSGNYLFTTDTK